MNRFDGIPWKEVCDRGIINIGNLARMGRVMEKAASGAPLKVAFIGGSITAGAAATTPETCYAYQVYGWWKDRFPGSKISYLNAGVGATTSQFGAARVSEDVLSLDPDVIFAEFSVNDEDDDFFRETFEGLLRKILLDKAEPALFMFNNVYYDDGHNAQRVHNQVGLYYDLPIVSMKESLYHLIEQGSLFNTDISADNLHPNDYGHKLVAGVICNLLDNIYHSVMNKEYAKEYLIPENPLTANRYFSSMRRSNRNTQPVLSSFTVDRTEKKDVWDVFRYGWAAKIAGSKIFFEVEGSMISVQYRKYAKHPAPVAIAVIDEDYDKAAVLDANFDETWGDKLFLQDVVTGGKPGKHTVEIVITEAVEDKEFYLASIITA